MSFTADLSVRGRSGRSAVLLALPAQRDRW